MKLAIMYWALVGSGRLRCCQISNRKYLKLTARESVVASRYNLAWYNKMLVYELKGTSIKAMGLLIRRQLRVLVVLALISGTVLLCWWLGF